MSLCAFHWEMMSAWKVAMRVKEAAVTSAAQGMPRGRHVSLGVELAAGQGRPDSYFARFNL